MTLAFTLLSALTLVTALSMDAMVAGFAYGADRISIPLRSTLVITVICTTVLGGSLLAGRLLSPLFSPSFTKACCFIILFLLGLVKLFDSSLKTYIMARAGFSRKLSFSLFHLQFILSVYADPKEADLDRSRTLSATEAASLAFALSLDGLAVGFGAGLASFPVGLVLLLNLLFGIAAILLGAWLGRRFCGHCSYDLSWLSGALLILLAILKL